MSDELSLIETKSLNSDVSRAPGYQATSNGNQATADGYQGTTELTASVNTAPVKPDISSGVQPSLSILETFGLVFLMLVSPLLTQPLPVSTSLFTRAYMHGISLTVVYICGILISGLFAELHQYHGNNTGGVVWVARKYSGPLLSYFVNSALILSALLQVALSLTDLSDLVIRQSDHFFNSQVLEDWAFSESILALGSVLVLFLLSLLGVTMVSRVGVIVALFALASVFTVSGYAIHNQSNTTAVTTSVELTLVEDDTDIDIRSEAALDPYFTHFFTLIGQVVVVVFLVPLTEDNSLKKSSINIVGVVTILLSYTCVMFLNLPVLNVASPDIQYVDQIASKVGVSDNLSLAISVGGCLCVLLRGYFILLAVCRVVLHLVVVAEQQQGNSCCALLKVPHVVFGAQCAVLVGLVFIGKQQLSTLTLISLFLLMLCGAICHILHRYSTPVPSESRPILGSFGSLKSGRTVNILIIVLIISSTALASANVARNTISFESYLNGQLYATFSICIALAVIGTISLMASFQQQRYIHVFYKILLWTPIIPSAVIMLCCVALVYKWKWGCVAAGIVGIATITHAVAVWLGSKKLPEAGSSTASGSSESELGSVEDNGR